MASGYVIRKNQYYDSVFLMRVAKTLNDEAGVEQSAVVMATDANKELVAQINITGSSIDAATPNDLIIAIIASEMDIVERLLANIDQSLESFSDSIKSTNYHVIEEAAQANPDANLVVISVPGAYAAQQAQKALEGGKHVFLFSDNVSIEEEVKIKEFARARGLLVMGPDCGTSLIGGTGIGFANKVRRGPIGVVGASGTGIQEFTSLVHQSGSGISHAIGTGSHDLSDAVGGITALMGLEALDADSATKVITIISKPAGAATLNRVIDRIRTCAKPVVACFLGLQQSLDNVSPVLHQAHSIDEAVSLSLAQVGIKLPAGLSVNEGATKTWIAQETAGWRPAQRYLRGLFAGGTFCYQAQQMLRSAGIQAYSNAPLDKRYRLASPEVSLEHTIIDMGDDFFTQGKPHPMIDATQRRKRLFTEAEDPEVCIILLDFILGYIASNDPVGDLITAIQRAKEIARKRGDRLTFVASICGTDQDTQDFGQQDKLLQEAGVLVFPTNASAARFCAELILAKEGILKNGK